MEEEEDDEEEVNVKRTKLEETKVDMPFTCHIEIPFPTAHSAEITMKTLEVDKELTPDKVRRVLQVKDNILIVDIYSTEQRLLRASLASFFDMAMVALRFLCEFAT